MFKTIEIDALSTVSGGAGAGYNTGITGGIKGINNKVPRPPSADPGYNTGITGGIHGINNKVPRPHSAGHNTGITGGIHGINNKVPWFIFW